LTGIVVEHPIAVVVERVAGLDGRRPGLAIGRVARRALTRAPTETAARAYELVYLAIAIVVSQIANLDCAGVDCGVCVVAVAR